MVDKDLAIRNTHSTVTTISHSSPLKAWDEKGNTVVLNQSLISAEVTRLQAAYDAKAYSRKRAAEYPSIADQLDDIYHNGIDAWKATIKTTKDKYPKE
jgi:hypothetical protein